MTTQQTMAWHKGDALRKARETAGLIQDELAERLGVNVATVRRAESGEYLIKPERAMAWANATGVPYDELQSTLDNIGTGWALWDSNPQPAVYGYSRSDLRLAA